MTMADLRPEDEIAIVDLEGKELSSGPGTGEGPLTLMMTDGKMVVPTSQGRVPGYDCYLVLGYSIVHYNDILGISGPSLKAVVSWSTLPSWANRVSSIMFHDYDLEGQSNYFLRTSPNLLELPSRLPPWLTQWVGLNNCSTFNSPNVKHWDVTQLNMMDNMFHYCSNFNQDLSGWCVSKFKSKPTEFDDGCAAWTLPRPIWGTCPPR